MSTTYETIKHGSSGQSVRELQQLLNARGYSVKVDGQFGDQTRQAVLDYQKKNGLGADGVVGAQTWGKLQSTGEKSYAAGYSSSQSVLSAKSHLDEIAAQRPGEYESPYGDALTQLYGQLVNRPAFSYDANQDPLYQQYRQQYTRLGRLAMEDTMGRAAGLTGGYSSTYSQSAGQQSYQNYLSSLNDMIPQLYELALQRYTQQTDALSGQYDRLYGLETQARSQYDSAYDRWFKEYTQAQDRYDSAQEVDFDQYMDMLSYWQKQAQINASASKSSGSSRSSSSSSESSTKEPTTKELKALAQEYMRLGSGAHYGSQAMLQWMSEKGIGEASYDSFYTALRALGYLPHGSGGNSGKTNTVNYFN